MNDRSDIYHVRINVKQIDSNHTMIINYIKDNSCVLDVGCACGDIGIALKALKNIRISAFESSQESINIALATNAYEEVTQVDLDTITVDDFIHYREKFDYIICGDILEHLRNPTKTLSTLKLYLKHDGYFIASVPNVSHASIKASLLVNDFTYTPIGLLDETHIHLFTYKSIAKAFAKCSLEIQECQFTKLKDCVGWQPYDPFLELPDTLKEFIFTDWHSFVSQYVMKVSISTKNYLEIFNINISKLNINENNAPEYIKTYRQKLLGEKYITPLKLNYINILYNRCRYKIGSLIGTQSSKSYYKKRYESLKNFIK